MVILVLDPLTIEYLIHFTAHVHIYHIIAAADVLSLDEGLRYSLPPSQLDELFV